MFSPINPSYVRTEVLPTAQTNQYAVSVATADRAVLIPSVAPEVIATASAPTVADLSRRFESYDSLGNRIDSVEKLVQSAIDKTAQDVKAMRDSANINEHHRATAHSRLEYLERLIDSHMAQWKAERSADAERVSRIDARMGEFGRICSRVDELGDKLGSILVQSAQHMQLNTTVDIRLNSLESLCKDNLEKLQASLEKQQMGREVKGRIENIEQYISQFEKRQEKSLKEVKDAAIALRSRMNHLESLVGDNVDNHDSLRSAMQDLQQGVDKFDSLHKLTEHHATLSERIDYLERTIGESADGHARALREIQMGHRKHQEHQASMEQRLEYLEKVLGDDADKHVSGMERLNEFEHQLSNHATVATRIDYLEAYLGVDADRGNDQAKIATTVERRLKSLEGTRTGAQARYDSPSRGPRRNATPPMSILTPSVPVSALRVGLLPCSPQISGPSRGAGVHMRKATFSPTSQHRELSPLPLSSSFQVGF